MSVYIYLSRFEHERRSERGRKETIKVISRKLGARVYEARTYRRVPREAAHSRDVHQPSAVRASSSHVYGQGRLVRQTARALRCVTSGRFNYN